MYNPKILGFLCNWCSYAGADLAGVSRFSYPPNLRIIRVMCSGRIDPIFILTAFERGLDGILVAGCHPGDCHYISGNYHAKYKVLMTKKILKKIGFDVKRLRLEWVSAAEGKQFADLITEFTEELIKLGPPLVKSDKNLIKRLFHAKQICSDFRLRWLISRERDLIEIENAYGEKISEEKFEKLLDDIIETELIKVKIQNLIEEKGLSAEEISSILKIPSKKVMEHLIALNDEHKVAFSIRNKTAIFIKEGGEIK